MSEHTFDARITVEAESREAAADLILVHCMTGADIAVALFSEGTLNAEARRAEVAALTKLLRDVHYDLLIRAQFRDGMKVVDLSSTTWIRLCDALKPAESLTKEA